MTDYTQEEQARWEDYGDDNETYYEEGEPSQSQVQYMHYYSEPISLRAKFRNSWWLFKHAIRYRLNRKYRESVDDIPF